MEQSMKNLQKKLNATKKKRDVLLKELLEHDTYTTDKEFTKLIHLENKVKDLELQQQQQN